MSMIAMRLPQILTLSDYGSSLSLFFTQKVVFVACHFPEPELTMASRVYDVTFNQQ